MDVGLRNGTLVVENNRDVEKKRNKRITLKDKVFIPRNSLLTDLFEVKQFKNIYCCFIVVVITLVINHIGHDVIYKGELRLERLIFSNYFVNIDLAAYKCGLNLLTNFLTPFLFYVWAFVYRELNRNGELFWWMRKIWNLHHIASLVFCYSYALNSSAEFVTDNKLQFLASVLILVEQVRLIMKSYAYVRTNAGKVVSHNYRKDKPLELLKISKYLYFVFVPTLVYKDEYPRTKRIRWMEVIKYMGEIFAGIFLMTYIFENHFFPICMKFQSSTFSYQDIVWEILRGTLASISMFFIVFYFTLHIWMNLFAELLTFSDRQFYEDWWNTTSYTVYYRKWNIIVHDFLYTYFYKDIIENVTPNSTILPKLSVFLISSVFHEYIIYYTLNMFYPVLFVLFFGFGVLLTFVKVPENMILNIMFLYGIAFGNSIFLNLYVMEACARRNDCSLSLHENVPFIYSSTFSSNCTR